MWPQPREITLARCYVQVGPCEDICRALPCAVLGARRGVSVEWTAVPRGPWRPSDTCDGDTVTSNIGDIMCTAETVTK